MNTQALSKYNQLENMGFGLKKLQFLCTTVNEIAFENNLPVQNAVEKFLSDIEQQYDSKLGFESKIKDLRDEINKLNHGLNRVRSELLLMPLVGPKIIKLTQSGVSEADIINIAALFEKNIPGFKLQSFISELEKYGSLKSNIERLAKESQRLNKEVNLFQTRSRDLDEYHSKTILNLAESRRVFDYMDGLVTSLRTEILGLASIALYAAYLIRIQFENLENLKLDRIIGAVNKFDSLRRASNGKESVSIQAIKNEVIMAIEVMQSKLGVNDRLREILSNTLIALTGKTDN